MTIPVAWMTRLGRVPVSSELNPQRTEQKGSRYKCNGRTQGAESLAARVREPRMADSIQTTHAFSSRMGKSKCTRFTSPLETHLSAAKPNRRLPRAELPAAGQASNAKAKVLHRSCNEIFPESWT